MPKKSNNPMPGIYKDLLIEPCNPLIERAMETGAIPIGYTCSYVPEVLLSIDHLIPIRLRAPNVTGTEIADIYLSSVICSYTRSLLEFAMDERYDFLGGWVFAASCDHLRRLYDNLEYTVKPSFLHILDVPHRFGEHQLAWYTEELYTLTEKLSSQFHVKYTHESISEAIKTHNAFSSLLLSIGELRKSRYPLLSGTEFHTLMLTSLITPKDLALEKIQNYKDSLLDREGLSDYRARFVLVGGQLDDPDYIGIIESTGGIVVADHLCTGSIPGLDLIESSDDPIQTIARHYLNKTACPRMMEAFDARVEAILTSVDEYNADGVIIEFVKFCDTWGIEAGLMSSAIRKKGVPVLCLEREYRLTGEGQLRTRIQAFIESMGK